MISTVPFAVVIDVATTSTTTNGRAAITRLTVFRAANKLRVGAERERHLPQRGREAAWLSASARHAGEALAIHRAGSGMARPGRREAVRPVPRSVHRRRFHRAHLRLPRLRRER